MPISRPWPRTSSTRSGCCPHGGERLLQAKRLLLHGIEEAIFEHRVEHGIADRGRQRIAAEGRPVRSGRHALGGLACVASSAPSGKPPPMPFAIAMRSGVNAGPLVREQLAGAAHAALDLIEDEQQAVAVAQFAQGPQELGAARR